MRTSLRAALALLAILTLSLAACGGSPGGIPQGSGGGKDPAASAVEAYLSALVTKDAAKVSGLACKDFEQEALMNMDGFQAVKAELSGVSCKNAGTESGATLVACTGEIKLTYQNEVQSLDVSRQTYKVVQSGGDYRVCGYK